MALQYCGRLPYVAASEQKLDLTGLPLVGGKDEYNYIKNILLFVNVPLTSASTSDAISQKNSPAIASLVSVFDNLTNPFQLAVPTKGNAFRLMQQMANRSGPNDPVAIAANSNISNTLRLKYTLPSYLPGILKEPFACRQPVARLEGGQVKVFWAASTIYGTGQTIGSVTCDVYIEYETGDGLVLSPELVYHLTTPQKLDQDAVTINGKPLFLLGADLSYNGLVSSNDYTDVQVSSSPAGTNWLNRQPIDGFTHLYNQCLSEVGDADDAQLALPSSGSAEFVPLIVHSARQSLSKIPNPVQVAVTLVAGAGAPVASDLTYILSVVRPKQVETWARSMEKASLFPGAYGRIMRSYQQVPAASGFRGQIGTDHPQFPYLPTQIFPNL